MLEWTIGNLREEIKQPSNPFANLSQHGIRHAWVNALKVMIPDLTPDRMDLNSLSHGARDLKDSFILLCVWEEVLGPLQDCEVDALKDYLPAAQLGDDIYVWC
jgi:hypothetical protein